MLEDIYLPVVRDYLRTQLAMADDAVICHVDEKIPPVYAAKRQVTIYSTSAASQVAADLQHGLEIVSSFTVGLTHRTGQIPIERLFDRAQGDPAGLVPLARSVLVSLSSGRYDLQKLINDELATDAPGWELVEPFVFRGTGLTIRAVGPDHFYADPEAAEAGRHFGLWTNLEYVGGRFMISHL